MKSESKGRNPPRKVRRSVRKDGAGTAATNSQGLTSKWRGTARSEPGAWDDLIAVKLVQIAEIVSRGATQVYEAGFGVRNTELRILLLLGGGQKLSVNEISRHTGVDKAWISRSLEVMTRSGLVSRVPHATDSRKNIVSLTKKGERLLHTIRPIALRRNRHFLAGLSEKEVHTILDTLRERAEQLLLPKLESRPGEGWRYEKEEAISDD